MRIVLSDGSGLTSRQCATLLHRKGHEVHALAPAKLALSRMTRHVTRVHAVPPYGPDPLRWWAATLDILARIGADLLLPTQEQVAVISRRRHSVHHRSRQHHGAARRARADVT